MDRLPCIRSISLKNNGICDDHSQEILALLSIPKIRAIDLSCNEMVKLGASIGRKLRDEVTHLQWFDITQNCFLHDSAINNSIASGLKKQKDLRYAGLSSIGPTTD